MTPRRAAAYLGVFSLLAAWLASAAGVIGQPRAPRTAARSVAGTAGDGVAFDVQAQADRLRQRLATAPTPMQPARNPFTFGKRQVAEPRRQASVAPQAAPVTAPPVVLDPEPELTLIGVAEQKTSAGLTRTAMIAGRGNQLLMVTTGETVAGRYRVGTVGAEAVELSDITTGRVRTLALK